MILAATAAEPSAETFTSLMDHVAQGFEALGAAILVAGVIWSFVLAAVADATFRVVGPGLPGTAAGVRRDPAARPGSPGRRRSATYRRGRADPRQRSRARADRRDQDVPELLAGNRDRGRRAVAAGPDGWRRDDPPGLGERARVRDSPGTGVRCRHGTTAGCSQAARGPGRPTRQGWNASGAPGTVRTGWRLRGDNFGAGLLLAGQHGHGLAFQVDVWFAADVDGDPLDRAAGEHMRVRARVVTGHGFAAVAADA